MAEVLIVGASRGIGLGLVGAFRSRGWDVTATVRDASKAEGLDGATVETVDVSDEASRAALAGRLDGKVFDAIVLNAGVSGPRRMGGADDELLHTLHANAVGPTQLAWALKNAVRPATGVVAFTTSLMGSVADNGQGGADTYRASKAALNSYARSFFQVAAKPKGVAVLSLHPGWVKTDMGGDNAPVTVEQSARGLAEVVVAHAGRAEHRFLDYTGKELPW